MPPEIAHLLYREAELTEEEWIDFLNHRRDQFKPHLTYMTLRQLGDVPCLKRYNDGFGGKTSLSDWRAHFGIHPGVDSGLDLDTQGLFHIARMETERDKTAIWGIARSGDWVLAEVSWRQEGPKQEPFAVRLYSTGPKTIRNALYGFGTDTYDRILRGMSAWAKDWEERERKRMHRVQELFLTLRHEDRIISALPGR